MIKFPLLLKISTKGFVSLSNNSIRQIVHISESGDNLRIKLSNKFGKTDLVIREITIADSASQGSGEVDVNTLVPLTFNGKAGVTIPSGSEIYSDTVPYPHSPLRKSSSKHPR